MGSRGPPERVSRPNILQQRQPGVVPLNQPHTMNPQQQQPPRHTLGPQHPRTATITRPLPHQNQSSTPPPPAVSTTTPPNILLDPQFRQMYPTTFNAMQLHQQRQVASLQAARTVPVAHAQPQSLRALPSASGQASSAQFPHPNQNIIQPGNFRPRLPITPEVLDGLFRAQAQARNYSVPAATTTLATLKRQASPTGDRPVKRFSSNPLKTIPFPSGVLLDEEQALNFMCSLCFEQFKDPHITPCGHTFCLPCIERFLLLNSKCPNCNGSVTRENVAPNRALHQLMRKHKENEKAITSEVAIAATEVVENGDSLEDLDVHSFFQKKYNNLSLGEVNLLMSMLARKKEMLYNQSEECRRSLMHDFLSELQQMKQAELNKVLEELGHINSDLACVESLSKSTGYNIEENSTGSNQNQTKSGGESEEEPGTSTSKVLKNGVKDISFSSINSEHGISQPSLAQRKLKIHSHFPTLANMYLKSCHGRLPSSATESSAVDSIGEIKTRKNERLESFSDALVKISRYSSFKLQATLTYDRDPLTNANIVSTIEFDKDKDFFAIAGVSKKILVFEYGSVIAAAVKFQTPNAEIACSSKISCISYSHFYKNKLASSDYDGKVIIYDTSTCEPITSLNEHEKRVWSVDFSDSDPRFLVSGSDDCKVKLWSITQSNSGTTLQTHANVCCVKFIPGSSYSIACGSADHCIHYYDIRQPKGPLRVFEGHKKAVSYVEFASKNEFVSASTDANLKLWDLNSRDCVRSYVGHINDKNFVGLTTDGNYVACGSEDNSVYIYYKDISAPILSYKFENYRSMINPARQEEISCEFVSAVSWRTGSPVLVAANSQGIIKVLELI